MANRLRFLAAALALAAAPALSSAQGDGRDLTTWKWDGTVAAGHRMSVHNIIGQVKFVPSSDNLVHVVAVKRANGGDISEITFQVVQSNGDVNICAIWENNGECDADGVHSHSHNDHNRASVDFTVSVPRNIRVSAGSVIGAVSVQNVGTEVHASTVNGSCEVVSALGPVHASTVNGGVSVTTSTGPVSASTVNGDVEATMTSLTATDDMHFSTVNGSITVNVPSDFGANVSFSTMHGSIGSDFPITLSGRFGPRSASGTIGNGGRDLHASTINGSIDLRKTH